MFRGSWIIFLCFSIISCKKEPRCWKGIGSVQSQQRLVDEDFNVLLIDDKLDVFITQDTVNRIIVEAGENLIPHVVTHVDTGALLITNRNTCAWLRNYKKEQITVRVHVKQIDRIVYSGNGEVRSTNSLKSDVFTYEQKQGSGATKLSLESERVNVAMHTGTGDLQLNGYCHILYLFSNSHGFFEGKQLEADIVFSSNYSTGDLYVKAKDRLEATVYSSGSIYYSGDPDLVKAEDFGEGEIETYK